MNMPGPLVDAAGFPLSFRIMQPAPAQPRNLLVLLHGVGGNETNLAALAARVGPDTLVVLPRGPIALGPEAFGWFRVAFTGEGPRIVASEAEASRRTLIEFVAQLQADHGIDAARSVIAGFSQGGILSASVALSSPETVAGFAVLAGRILPELEPQIVEPARLTRLHGFIAHGRLDDKLPVDWAQRADAWLTRLGVAHETRLYPAGHALDPAMQHDFLGWFQNIAGHRNAATVAD